MTFSDTDRRHFGKAAPYNLREHDNGGALATADEFQRGMPGLIADGRRTIHDAGPAADRKSGCPPFSKESSGSPTCNCMAPVAATMTEGRIPSG